MIIPASGHIMGDDPSHPLNAAVLPIKDSDMDSGTAVFHRSLLKSPDRVSHASGITLHLDDGRSVIDACGGAAVACLGKFPQRNLSVVTTHHRLDTYKGLCRFSNAITRAIDCA